MDIRDFTSLLLLVLVFIAAVTATDKQVSVRASNLFGFLAVNLVNDFECDNAQDLIDIQSYSCENGEVEPGSAIIRSVCLGRTEAVCESELKSVYEVFPTSNNCYFSLGDLSKELKLSYQCIPQDSVINVCAQSDTNATANDAGDLSRYLTLDAFDTDNKASQNVTNRRDCHCKVTADGILLEILRFTTNTSGDDVAILVNGVKSPSARPASSKELTQFSRTYNSSLVVDSPVDKYISMLLRVSAQRGSTMAITCGLETTIYATARDAEPVGTGTGPTTRGEWATVTLSSLVATGVLWMASPSLSLGP